MPNEITSYFIVKYKFTSGNRVQLKDGRKGVIGSWPFRIGRNTGKYPVWISDEHVVEYYTDEEMEMEK